MRKTLWAAPVCGLFLAAMVVNPIQAAAGEEPCTVASSFGKSEWLTNSLTRDLNHSIQQEANKLLGGGPVKERIADQVRRGFIGTAIDEVSRTVHIVVTPEYKEKAELSSRLAGVASMAEADIKVNVLSGCNKAERLAEADDLLYGRAWHPDARRASFGYSLDAATSRLRITFDPRFADAAAALKEQIGDVADVELTGKAGRMGRNDDGEPHFGGAGIRQNSGSSTSNYCTAGFTAKHLPTGYRGGFTAGHCFSNNVNIYSGPQYWAWSYGKLNYPTYDVIGMRSASETFDNVIFTDNGSPATRNVTARQYANVGDNVCFSGKTTKAICSIQITGLNASFCDADGCTYGLIEAIRGGGVVIARNGDSGAPIFEATGTNSANALGMLVASAGGGTIAYGEHYYNIESYLSVTVMTS